MRVLNGNGGSIIHIPSRASTATADHGKAGYARCAYIEREVLRAGARRKNNTSWPELNSVIAPGGDSECAAH